MIDFFMKMNLVQYAAIAGAVVLLIPVMSDLIKSGVLLAGRAKVAVTSRKKKGIDTSACFSHVMCVRRLLAKSGDAEALKAYDDLIIPNLVRVLSETESPNELA